MNDTLIKILLSLPGVKKPQRNFLLELFTVMMCFVGKANFRNLSRYSTSNEKRFCRWSKRVFDYTSFNVALLKESFSLGGRERIGVVDACFLSKSGKKTQGVGRFWNGSSGKADKGLEISTAGIVDMKSMTCYSLLAEQTVMKGKRTKVEVYAKHLKSCVPYFLQLGVTYIVGDGYYAKKKIVDVVQQQGLHFISKLRCDANLRFASFAPQKKGRGRKRKYGAKITLDSPLTGVSKLEPLPDGTLVYSCTVYAVAFKQKIKVVVLRKEKSQAVLFCTDLFLSPEKIVEYYKARFQVEFVFRDAKQHTGLEDCQARSAQQIHNHVNASLSVLNILKIEDRNAKGVDEQSVISIDSWRRKKLNQLLLTTIFQKLDIDQSCQKINNLRKELENFGVLAA
jgi:Transposase DDE domain